MYIQPVQPACPGTSLLMGDSIITVAGVVSGITAITLITLSLSACPGYQYAHAWIQAQACQQHVGTCLQLWMPCNRNNTNNICFAPMPWAAGIQHPAYDAQGMYLPCFRMLHILGVAACINHGKGGRVALWYKARHWWLLTALEVLVLQQGHAFGTARTVQGCNFMDCAC